MINAIRFAGAASIQNLDVAVKKDSPVHQEQKQGLSPALFWNKASLQALSENRHVESHIKTDAFEKVMNTQPRLEEQKAAYSWLNHLLSVLPGVKQLEKFRDHNIPWVNYAIAVKKPALFNLLKKHGAKTASFDDIQQAQHGLNLAITTDDRERLKKYLAIPGVNVNTATHTGQTPLHLAIIMNSHDLVEDLLAARADVNQTDRDGRAALHKAVIQGNMDTIKALIQAGSKLDQQDNEGDTPLHRAVLWGNDDIVQALIDAKADLNIPDNEGQTPLFTAVMSHDADTVKVLLKAKPKLDTPTNKDFTALYQAILNGDSQIAKALIDAGADVNRQDQFGRTPLLRAAISGNRQIVDDLLAAGAIVKHEDIQGRSPLGMAVLRGNKPVAQALVDARDRQQFIERHKKRPHSELE